MRSWSDRGVNHLSTFDADLRNVSFALISFMGFPAILSTLQPFHVYIYNRKYSKLTFSNDSQLMGNRFMANLHASLESTCKSRISKIATRCQNWGVNHLSLWLWIFLILFILILEGYFLQNRIIFDSVDKLLPVSNMAYFMSEEMLDTIILYTLKVYQKMFIYNFVIAKV